MFKVTFVNYVFYLHVYILIILVRVAHATFFMQGQHVTFIYSRSKECDSAADLSL